MGGAAWVAGEQGTKWAGRGWPLPLCACLHCPQSPRPCSRLIPLSLGSRPPPPHQVRPDRQTLLFSATMPRKVERLVTDALTTPVRITVRTFLGGGGVGGHRCVTVRTLGRLIDWSLMHSHTSTSNGEGLKGMSKLWLHVPPPHPPMPTRM